MKQLFLAALFVASLAGGSAQAADAMLSLAADVPRSISIVDTNGAPLTVSSIKMDLDPATGKLRDGELRFRLITNFTDEHIDFRWPHDAKLVSAAHEIPLRILLDGMAMDSEGKMGYHKTVFPTGSTPDGGRIQTRVFTLSVAQLTSDVPAAGQYSGRITLTVKPRT